ncbi:MAG: hypothetical protein ABJB05_01925 [Parafilimonas sp.]
MRIIIRKAYLSSVFIFSFAYLNAASIILNTRNATAWLPQQTITGVASGLSSQKIIWHCNNSSALAKVNAIGSFTFSCTLTTNNNIIWAEDVSHTIISDTIITHLATLLIAFYFNFFYKI